MAPPPQAQVAGLVRTFYAQRRTRVPAAHLRSLAPICTALEAYNHKRALLLADQLIHKSPHDPSALALKALALSLASPPARADVLAVVDSARTANGGAALADADVLMLLLHVLRAIGQGDDALRLLAEAVQKHPDQEDLSTEAFLQQVRAQDRKGAQQTALRMAKHFSDERYFWWSILSTILVVREGGHPDAPLLLAIAERQLANRYTPRAAGPEATPDGEGASPVSYASADEFHLVTRLLELRAQASTADPVSPSSSPAPATSPAAVMAGSRFSLPSLPPEFDTSSTAPSDILLAHFASPEADKWCATNLGLELWRRQVSLEYGTVENGAWTREVGRLVEALEKGDTNWHTMLYLIRISIALAAGATLPPSSVPTSGSELSEDGLEHLTRARTLFQRLDTDSPKAKVERGYLLALLELAREARAHHWAQGDSLSPLVQDYFERYGSKACCFDDLRPYVETLEDNDRVPLQEFLREVAGGAIQTIAMATKVINAHKILRFIAPAPTTEGEQKVADELVKRYFEALPLGKDLPPTELQPADDFALLAGQAFVSAYHLSHDRAHLERAIVVADHALQRSKYKYQLRLLLINLLRLVGASSQSVTHYRSFGVKNIQHDTLSHVVLARAATFAIEQGGTRAAAGVWEEMLATEAWYPSGTREAQDMVVKAFNYGAWAKVEDFSVFRDQLQRSLQGGLVHLEALRMRVLRGQLDADHLPDAMDTLAKLVQAVKAEDYNDHRDYKTLPNYQRQHDPSIWQQTELAPRQDSAWLQALAGAYSRFVSPSIAVDVPAEADLPPSLTRSEAALVTYSRRAQATLVAPLTEAASDSEEAAVAFFKEQSELFAAALEDPQTLPWELVQIVQVALEGFALLELGINQRLDELALEKAPDQAKHQKRLRTLRNAAREPLKALGVKLTAYGKKVGKDRGKFVAAVQDLTRFEALDENRITNVAHAVTESRKSTIEALGFAIHRRTAK